MSGPVIPPPLSSAPTRLMPYIVSGVAIASIWFFVVYLSVRDANLLPTPASHLCEKSNGEKDCNRVELFAFQMTTFWFLLACAAIGVYSWHVTKRVHTQLPNTPEGRLFGYLPEAELVAAVCFTFQVWDFFFSIPIPENGTAIMLSHHILAATVSWCSIRYQYLHYYGIFFLGLSEVSSIFLVFVDFSRYFPPTPGTAYDAVTAWIFGPAFAVLFLYYRIILWWPISYQLFRDVQHVVKTGKAQQMRPGATWVLYLFLACNIPLGILQLYWFTLIWQEAKKVLQIAV